MLAPEETHEDDSVEPQSRRAGKGSGLRWSPPRHLSWLWDKTGNAAVRAL